MVGHGFNPRDDILRQVAKLGDFLSGEHVVGIILSDLMKPFLILLHKNFPSTFKWKIRPSQLPVY
jgi:hypothetical protein